MREQGEAEEEYQEEEPQTIFLSLQVRQELEIHNFKMMVHKYSPIKDMVPLLLVTYLLMQVEQQVLPVELPNMVSMEQLVEQLLELLRFMERLVKDNMVYMGII